MIVQENKIWLKAITVLGLLATVVTLYATIATSPDAFEEDRMRSSTKLFRYGRAAEDNCLRVLTVKGSGSTLTSPNYPENYPSNAKCYWLITADDPNATISLKIDVLSVQPAKECRFDYLQIYLGATRLAQDLGPFCGNIQNRVIETNASRILLEFHSDMTHEDKGFSIDLFTKMSDCQASMTDESGFLRSPGFPNNYPDDTACWTLISVGENKKIILVFDSISLEFGNNCIYDYVQVFDGKTKNSTLLGQVCQQTDVRRFESSSNTLLVHFHSDDAVNKEGYRARYSSVDKRSFPIGDCRWKKDENTGTISSPNYPDNYPSSSNCSIWILAPKGSTVTITIDEILLQWGINDCSFDFLLISEGPMSDNKVLGRFCGMQLEPKQINSTQNEIRIQFQSDDSIELSGFKLKYHYNKEGTIVNEKFEDSSRGTLKFRATPENITVPEGSSSLLDCSTTHSTAKIRWLKGDMFLESNSSLPGLTVLANNSLWIQSMNRRLVGVYICLVISPAGELAAIAYVSMTEEPKDLPCEVDFKETPSDSEYEEGDFAYLECLAAGEHTVLSWEKDSEPLQTDKHITMLANSYIFIESVRLQDAGVYTCIARDKNSCVKRASADLKVNTKTLKISEICGRAKVGQSLKKESHSERGKITGGYDAKIGSHPWQVMLWEPVRKSFCGATLLNERWIATAANCFNNQRTIHWNNIRILLGKHKREGIEEEEFITSISEPSSIVIHPRFNQYNFDNDLALVRMRDIVHFSDHILPVCLGDKNTSEFLLNKDRDPGKLRMGTVVGWGLLKDTGHFAESLQEIRLPVVDQGLCKESTNFLVTQNMFCAGYSQEIVGDACSGDAGGPFLMSHEGRLHLVGIISWGEGCGKQHKYGFYTRIANYLPWIYSIIE